MRVVVVSFFVLIMVCSIGYAENYLVKGMITHSSRVSLESAQMLAIVDALVNVAVYEGEQRAFEVEDKQLIQATWEKSGMRVTRELLFDKNYSLIATTIGVYEHGEQIISIKDTVVVFSKTSMADLLLKTGFKLRQFRNDGDTLIAELVKE